MQKSIVRTTFRGLAGALALTAAALTGGCEEPPVPLIPTTLTVSPRSADFEDVTESVQLTATVLDQNGETMEDVTVHWQSGNQRVATIDIRGIVVAQEEGTAAVWGYVRELVDSVPISVKLGPRGVLMRVYRGLGGSNWNNDSNWGTSAPLGTWTGVGLDASGNVTGLTLTSNGVDGSIVGDIGLLEHLEELNLSGNDGLRGSLPPEIGTLESLTEFRNVSPMFSPGTFTGPIPPEFGNLANLEVVDFSGNELSGSLPPELGNLRSLRSFNVQGNGLRGTLPAEFGNLGNLTDLRINGNPMSGFLPVELTSLSLRTFHWHATHLCVPDDDDFKAWLESIGNHQAGDDCQEG